MPDDPRISSSAARLGEPLPDLVGGDANGAERTSTDGERGYVGSAQRPSVGSAQRPSLAESIRRYWFVVLLPALALLVAGLAIGLSREPTYEAEAQLNVGKVDVSTQAIPGFVEGAKSLASAYSRITVSQLVINPVARRLEISTEEARDRVSATPIAESTSFRINGEGSSPREAIAITQTATDELARYVRRLSASQSRSRDLLREFERESLLATRIDLRRQKLVNAQNAGGDVTDKEIEEVAVDAASAQLRVDAIAGRFQEDRRADAGALVSVLDAPRSTENDRSSFLQRLAFIGFFGGLLLGLAVAASLASRAWRRSLAA